MSLSDDDLNRIVDRLVEKTQTRHQDFWINPEDHYNAHQTTKRIHDAFGDAEISTLHDLIRAFRLARGLFLKAFLGLVIVGASVLAGLGAIKSVFTHHGG